MYQGFSGIAVCHVAKKKKKKSAGLCLLVTAGQWSAVPACSGASASQ
jgi:hypothetical protein